MTGGPVTAAEAAAGAAKVLAAIAADISEANQAGGPAAIAACQRPHGSDGERAVIAEHWRRVAAQQAAGKPDAA